MNMEAGDGLTPRTSVCTDVQGPILLAWFNFNSNMDK